MEDVDERHGAAISSLASQPGRVFVLGAVDSGKTTFARRLAMAAVEAGQTVALVDADVAQATIGAPGTVGLKLVSGAEDLDEGASPDAMAFVGVTSPRENVL